MIRKLIYIYILFLPFMKLPKLPFMADKIQYADLIFIPLFIIFMIRLYKEKAKIIPDKIGIFLLLLVVTAFLSFLRSSLKQEILPDFIGLIYLVLLYFVFTSSITKYEEFVKINAFLFVVTLIISIFGIITSIFYNIFNTKALSLFFYDKAINSQSSFVPFSRPSSFLVSPEMFINFMLLGLASAFLYRNNLHNLNIAKRRIIDLGITLIIFSVLFAFSRSLVGLMLFLVLMAFRFTKKKPLGLAVRIVTLTVFILLFFSASIFWVLTIYPVSFSVDKINRIANLSFNYNFDTRFYLAKAALAIGKEYPFLGLGMGLFTDNFTKFLSKKDVMVLSAIRQTPPSLLKLDPHSVYFGAIAELGYLGITMVLFIFIFILHKVIKSFRLSVDFHLKDTCYIFLSAILGYLLNGFFADILSMRSFWILMSLGVIGANLSEKANRVLKVS